MKIDLQVLLADAYQAGAYDLDIDYSRDPVPPLTAEQSAWAKELMAAQLQRASNEARG